MHDYSCLYSSKPRAPVRVSERVYRVQIERDTTALMVRAGQHTGLRQWLRAMPVTVGVLMLLAPPVETFGWLVLATTIDE